jgi:eukaryotic-like serine/threonine-protein kinase
MDGPKPSSRPGGAASLVGTVVGERYKLLRVIGEGGMSAVYGAEHALMHKPLAVKVLSPEMSKVPEAVTRFQREAVAASRIEHPNVVGATDFGSLEDGSFFLVLELVEGKTLRDAIAQGPMPLGRVLHVARQIAEGLARAHGLGIVHRDLKPDNVMLTTRGEDADFVKILDFGIAKVPPQEPVSEGAAPLTRVGMVYGTPEYMAPEQAMGKPVDARADLYALGVMLFEMVAGRRPWDDENKVVLLGRHISDPVPPLAGAPPSLVAVIRKLMSKEADERYQKAEDVVAALDAIPLPGAAFTPPIKTLPLEASAAAQRSPRSGLVRVGTHMIERLEAMLPLDRLPVALSRRGKLWLVLGLALTWVLVLGAVIMATVVHFTRSDERPRETKTAVDHRARCLAAASSGDHEAVIREAGAWSDGRSSAGDDLEIAKAVGGETPFVPDGAFDLLEHALGRSGADELYELAWGPSAAEQQIIATRAKHALEDDAVASHMSPALAVTVAIRGAKDVCDAKGKHFAQAASVGDARTLAVLTPYLKRGGCGRRGRADCHPCLRSGDDSVEKTVAAIRARTAGD